MFYTYYALRYNLMRNGNGSCNNNTMLYDFLKYPNVTVIKSAQNLSNDLK